VRSPVGGIGIAADETRLLQGIERGNDPSLVSADRVGQSGLGADRFVGEREQDDVTPHPEAVAPQNGHLSGHQGAAQGDDHCGQVGASRSAARRLLSSHAVKIRLGK
jgi:hypothetical protein